MSILIQLTGYSTPDVFRTYYAELSILVSDSNNRLSLANELSNTWLTTFQCYDSITDNAAKTVRKRSPTNERFNEYYQHTALVLAKIN